MRPYSWQALHSLRLHDHRMRRIKWRVLPCCRRDGTSKDDVSARGAAGSGGAARQASRRQYAEGAHHEMWLIPVGLFPLPERWSAMCMCCVVHAAAAEWHQCAVAITTAACARVQKCTCVNRAGEGRARGVKLWCNPAALYDRARPAQARVISSSLDM